jgi:hypothetical protein
VGKNTPNGKDRRSYERHGDNIGFEWNALSFWRIITFVFWQAIAEPCVRANRAANVAENRASMSFPLRVAPIHASPALVRSSTMFAVPFSASLLLFDMAHGHSHSGLT